VARGRSWKLTAGAPITRYRASAAFNARNRSAKSELISIVSLHLRADDREAECSHDTLFGSNVSPERFVEGFVIV
jgi:hypothetical protein